MMTLHELAVDLTARLRAWGNLLPDREKEKKVVFALEGLLATCYSLLVVFLVSLLLGTVKETLAIVLIAGSLRIFTGGVHARTPTRCALAGGMVFGVLGLGAKYLPWQVGYLATPAVFLGLAAIILVFAPRETINKKIPPEQRRVLRRWTVFVLLVFFFLLVYHADNLSLAKAMLLGMGWQAFTVSPVLKEKGE